VEEAIAAWSPHSAGAEAVGFARPAVAAARPASAGRARALLWAAAKVAHWAPTVGLPVVGEVLFSTSTIERFMATGAAGFSGPTRRTLRSNLRHLQRAALPGPSPARLPRERAKAPYTEAQMAGFLALADAQPTISRRMRAQALLCLGAGAGLMGADLRGARGTDVVERSGGLVVVVRGARPRVVPVLAAYRDRLSASAAFAGAHYLIGGRDRGRKNVTTPLIGSLAGGADLPRLDTGRLRSTWLAAVAKHLGIGAFLTAAGIRCTQRLGDIVAALPEVDEDDAVRLLGGAS
jgi:integrase